jgi:hypothetical protein
MPRFIVTEMLVSHRDHYRSRWETVSAYRYSFRFPSNDRRTVQSGWQAPVMCSVPFQVFGAYPIPRPVPNPQNADTRPFRQQPQPGTPGLLTGIGVFGAGFALRRRR